jgi:hypothetical protein
MGPTACHPRPIRVRGVSPLDCPFAKILSCASPSWSKTAYISDGYRNFHRDDATTKTLKQIQRAPPPTKIGGDTPILALRVEQHAIYESLHNGMMI